MQINCICSNIPTKTRETFFTSLTSRMGNSISSWLQAARTVLYTCNTEVKNKLIFQEVKVSIPAGAVLSKDESSRQLLGLFLLWRRRLISWLQ